MLTIYGRATSSNVQLVMWTIAELGLEARRLDYGHVHGGTRHAGVLAMNPHGRVPVMRDGDLVIWESAAILRYLAARYGDGGAFWPADPLARAPGRHVGRMGQERACAGLHRPDLLGAGAHAGKPIATRRRWPARWRGSKSLWAVLEGAAEGRYAAGAAFTLADIVIGHLLLPLVRHRRAARRAPAVEAYYERLTGRPAYREHVMVSYAPLRAEGA
jgi:glutathione S-transferase